MIGRVFTIGVSPSLRDHETRRRIGASAQDLTRPHFPGADRLAPVGMPGAASPAMPFKTRNTGPL